jgi:hypothetical protein
MAEQPIKRNPLLRFWPLVALLGVQALIIAIAPSTAPSTLTSSAPGIVQTTPTTSVTSTTLATGATTTTALGAPAGETGSSIPSLGSASTTTLPASAVGAAGNTAHCVGGREFSTALAWYAPPCVAGTIGAADPSNGGATAQGVTGTQITIVDYYADDGPEVNAILQAQGQYVSYSGESLWDQAMQNFINSHYVLYGRKVKIIPYDGQCQAVPPDTTCLTAEMDSIVQTYSPYIIMWNENTLCSACYAEIAHDRTIAIGGTGFSDELADDLAPYFYSADQSSSRIETAFAQWWCSQMSSVNDPSRVVKYAGNENKSQDFNGQPRRLGVISTNDPDNENTVTEVLAPALEKDCGDKIWHTYFYSQNINTAAQQVTAGVAAMDTGTDPANAVLCLCDTVAPQFLYEGGAAANYWPEVLMADDQFMDLDVTSQDYESGVACPTSSNCEYSGAFGLSPVDPQPPQGTDPASVIWKAEGETASLTATMGSDADADNYLENFIMMANLIENTGPDLTAANMQARAPLLGSVGGGTTGHQLLGFAPGDWHWVQDDRVVYWDNNAVSPYDNSKGTFCQIEGARFNLGQFPTETAGPPVPNPRPATC